MFLTFQFSMFLFDIAKLDKDFFQCVNLIKKLDLIIQIDLVSLKATEGLNTYKHGIKKHFLERMKNNESNTYS